jgi:hypothetical protein
MEGIGRKGLEWKEMVGMERLDGHGRGRVGRNGERDGRHGDAAREAFLELSHHRVN